MPEYGSWVYESKLLVSRRVSVSFPSSSLSSSFLILPVSSPLAFSFQYSRGLLLSIDQYSPTQFDKMEIVFSSNEAGTFNIDILIVPPGHNKTTIGQATVTMQEVSTEPSKDPVPR